ENNRYACIMPLLEMADIGCFGGNRDQQSIYRAPCKVLQVFQFALVRFKTLRQYNMVVVIVSNGLYTIYYLWKEVIRYAAQQYANAVALLAVKALGYQVGSVMMGVCICFYLLPGGLAYLIAPFQCS